MKIELNAASRLYAASLTEKAAEFRDHLKKAGIKVRVRVAPGGGQVQVISPSYTEHFKPEDSKKIRQIAIDLGYTGVRGTPINLHTPGDPNQFNFYPGS